MGMMLGLNNFALASRLPNLPEGSLVPYGFEEQFGRPSPWDSQRFAGEPMPSPSQTRSLRSYNRYLNWQEWNLSNHENGDICHENNGNIVCLSSDSAAYLRW
jgi:hypothetical protein